MLLLQGDLTSEMSWSIGGILQIREELQVSGLMGKV